MFLTQCSPLLLKQVCHGVSVLIKHPDWKIHMFFHIWQCTKHGHINHYMQPHENSEMDTPRHLCNTQQEQSSAGTGNPAAIRLGPEDRHSHPCSSRSNLSYNIVLFLKETGLFIHFIVHLSTQIPSHHLSTHTSIHLKLFIENTLCTRHLVGKQK